jgi:sugar lactone lactonase YvrE
MRSFFLASIALGICFASCNKTVDPPEPSSISIAKERYELPVDTLFPEGIAYNGRTGHFFVGSVASGDIYKVNVQNAAVTLFGSGASQQRTAANGLRLDQSERLWVCGGASATVSVLDMNGQLLRRWDMASMFGGQFINDVSTDGTYMYFTDSRVQKVYRAAISTSLNDMQEWLSFSDAAIPYAAGGTNANGIVTTPDNRYLLMVVSSSGKLYRIEIATKQIREVRLSEPINSGDGLLLEGQKLYVCRNATNRIFPVAMNADFTQGTVGTPFGDGLSFNTTMARAGGFLLVVNGQLNQRATRTPVLPFSVSRVPLP